MSTDREWEARTPTGSFGVLLDRFRREARLSQSRLAEAAETDHSHVSRLTCGDRAPSRDMVLRLAEAMDLKPAERDGLLMSAGFLPADGDLRDVLAGILRHPQAMTAFRPILAMLDAQEGRAA